MISATEARKLVSNNFSEDVQALMSAIEVKIKETKYFQVTIKFPPLHIAEELTTQLKALGYRVIRNKGGNQLDSWDGLEINF